MATQITKANFTKEVEESRFPVIIDIYASWCGPCQMMEPILTALENEMGAEYKFVKLNVDEARDLSIEFGVTSVPTFLFMKNKQIRGRETGYMDKEDLKKKITSYLS